MSKNILKAYKKALEIIGSKSELSRKLGLSRQSVTDWNVLKIPPKHVVKIEQLTNGKVKRSDLRPDLYN